MDNNYYIIVAKGDYLVPVSRAIESEENVALFLNYCYYNISDTLIVFKTKKSRFTDSDLLVAINQQTKIPLFLDNNNITGYEFFEEDLIYFIEPIDFSRILQEETEKDEECFLKYSLDEKTEVENLAKATHFLFEAKEKQLNAQIVKVKHRLKKYFKKVSYLNFNKDLKVDQVQPNFSDEKENFLLFYGKRNKAKVIGKTLGIILGITYGYTFNEFMFVGKIVDLRKTDLYFLEKSKEREIKKLVSHDLNKILDWVEEELPKLEKEQFGKTVKINESKSSNVWDAVREKSLVYTIDEKGNRKFIKKQEGSPSSAEILPHKDNEFTAHTHPLTEDVFSYGETPSLMDLYTYFLEFQENGLERDLIITPLITLELVYKGDKKKSEFLINLFEKIIRGEGTEMHKRYFQVENYPEEFQKKDEKASLDFHYETTAKDVYQIFNNLGFEIQFEKGPVFDLTEYQNNFDEFDVRYKEICNEIGQTQNYPSKDSVYIEFQKFLELTTELAEAEKKYKRLFKALDRLKKPWEDTKNPFSKVFSKLFFNEKLWLKEWGELIGRLDSAEENVLELHSKLDYCLGALANEPKEKELRKRLRDITEPFEA